MGPEASEKAAWILLVEDNFADARLVREALEEHAIRCELTLLTNGERAIEFIQNLDHAEETSCPGLVILDLNLPKRSGKEVLRCIRTSVKCRHATVAILSSSDNQKDKDDAESLGASRYIRKPSRLSEFLELGRVFKEMLSAPSH